VPADPTPGAAPDGAPGPHRFAVTVFYEDTDMGGIVYHANYLKFIERGRSAWVREAGIDQTALRAAGYVFVVRRVEADFRAPARLDDRLVVETEVLRATGARLVLDQRVRAEAGGAALFAAVVTLGAMTTAGRPARLPEAVRRHAQA